MICIDKFQKVLGEFLGVKEIPPLESLLRENGYNFIQKDKEIIPLEDFFKRVKEKENAQKDELTKEVLEQEQSLTIDLVIPQTTKDNPQLTLLQTKSQKQKAKELEARAEQRRAIQGQMLEIYTDRQKTRYDDKGHLTDSFLKAANQFNLLESMLKNKYADSELAHYPVLDRHIKDFSKGFWKQEKPSKADMLEIRKDIENKLNIKPIQEFGTNYAEHYHSGESAIQKLLAEKKGQVAGAFYREELGDIDLVWGEVQGKGKEAKGFGLAKIIEKHGDEFKNIAKELDEIIQNGEVVKRAGRDEAYNIEYNGFKVGINKGFNKKGENKWVVTAFDDNVEKTAKTAPANDSTKGASLPLNSSEIIPQQTSKTTTQTKTSKKSTKESKPQEAQDPQATQDSKETLKDEFLEAYEKANFKGKCELIKQDISDEISALEKQKEELARIIKQEDYTDIELEQARKILESAEKLIDGATKEPYGYRIKYTAEKGKKETAIIYKKDPYSREVFTDDKVLNAVVYRVFFKDKIDNIKKAIENLKTRRGILNEYLQEYGDNELKAKIDTANNMERFLEGVGDIKPGEIVIGPKYEKTLFEKAQEVLNARFSKAKKRATQSTTKNYNITYDEARKIFLKGDVTKEQKDLFESVLPIAQKLNVRIRTAIREPYEDMIWDTTNIAGMYRYELNTATLKKGGSFTDTQRAKTLLHELIHSVTSRAMSLHKTPLRDKMLTKTQIKAIDEIDQIYKKLYKFRKTFKLQDEKGADLYGITNAHEMLAELSNPIFSNKLKEIGLFEKVINNVMKIVLSVRDFIRLRSDKNAYEKLKQCLKDIIENYKENFSQEYEKLNLRDVTLASEFKKQKTLEKIDSYAKTQEFKALSKDKQEAILSLKNIEPSPMPQEISIKDLEHLQAHFESKLDKEQREKFLTLFNDTKENPHIVLEVFKNGELRQEYIKAYQHKESKDLYYIAISKDKRDITGIPTTQIQKVINDIAKSEKVIGAENFEGISNTAAPLQKQTSPQRSSAIIPQKTLETAMQKFNYDEKKAKDLLEWHKDSHPLTKDENGLPKVFYHGSEGFDKFETFTKDRSSFGFFFSTLLDEAEHYNSGRGGLYKTFLKVTKPFLADEVKIKTKKDLQNLSDDILRRGQKVTQQEWERFKEYKRQFDYIKKEAKKRDYKISETSGDVTSFIDKNGSFFIDDSNSTGALPSYARNEFDLALMALKIMEYGRNNLKQTLQAKGYDGIRFNEYQISVFDSNQIKHIDNKGGYTDTKGNITETKPKDSEAEHKYFNEKSPNIYQSNAHIGSGLVGGSVNGIEEDEEGNLTFNPQKFVLGFLGGAAGSKAVAKGLEYIKENPQLKEAVARELANTLSQGFKKAKEKYPLLSALEPRYIVQNQRGRIAQAKAMIKEAQEKALSTQKALSQRYKEIAQKHKALERVQKEKDKLEAQVQKSFTKIKELEAKRGKLFDYNRENVRAIIDSIDTYNYTLQRARPAHISPKVFVPKYKAENPPPLLDLTKLEPHLQHDVIMHIKKPNNHHYLDFITDDSKKLVKEYYNKLKLREDELDKEISLLKSDESIKSYTAKEMEFYKLKNDVEKLEKIIDTGYESRLDLEDDVNENIESLLEYYSKDEINRLKKLVDSNNQIAETILRNFDTPHYGRGYDRYSMSNNAVEAYENGIKPLSKWGAEDAKAFSEVVGAKFNLKELKELLQRHGEKGEHHTSKYYNATKFYSIAEAFLYGKKVLEAKGAKILDAFAIQDSTKLQSNAHIGNGKEYLEIADEKFRNSLSFGRKDSFIYRTQESKRIGNLRADLKEALNPYLNKEIINKQTGISARISTTGINKISSKKAVDKSVANGFTRDEHFKVASDLKNLFENAVRKESYADKKQSKDVKAMHRFFAKIIINNKQSQAKMTSKESVEYGNRIYSLELEKLIPSP